ncbi:MAG: sigma-70 family RNA polymerase sigma factor [Nannocystaceae bacterium]|nr:sigma-70 family RNA polymerase sigma factor [Nannocystaceae bacterium]
MYAVEATATFPLLGTSPAVFPTLGNSVAVFPPLADFDCEETFPELKDDEADEPVAEHVDDIAARVELEKLYREHGRRIYATAWRWVRDREEALDVVQEAFVRAHESLHRFRGRRPHYAWLHRVVVNICIDRQRRRERWSNVEPSVADVFWPEGDCAEDPERTAGRQELQETILESLKELSPAHRTVITLREFGGVSYNEIAELMSCRLGTVMSRLFHARRKLRTILEGKLNPSQLEQAC